MSHDPYHIREEHQIYLGQVICQEGFWIGSLRQCFKGVKEATGAENSRIVEGKLGFVQKEGILIVLGTGQTARATP